MEDYIVTGTTAKVCIQRLLNFLLVSLDNEKDYMKFCVVINSISVMTNLPYRMIVGNLITSSLIINTKSFEFSVTHVSLWWIRLWLMYHIM